MPHIIRIWRGKTPLHKADAYETLMKKLAAPDYSGVEGLISYTFTRANHTKYAEFLLITKWESFEAIRRFAGEDYTKAKYYPEDAAYLLEFPETVEHFEIFDSGEKIC